jgi:hypothetical protein
MMYPLETEPDKFVAVKSGDMKAYFRRNDKNYRVGDDLVLYPIAALPGSEFVVVRVTHALYGPDFGIPEGYAMLSFDVLHPDAVRA